MRFRLLIASVLALAGAAAQAQPGPLQPDFPRISVVGEGTVRASPDMATITLGVVSQAASARDALSRNTQSMSKIVAALKAAGIEPRDLQTSGFSVQPVYSQPPPNYDNSQPFEPKIVGYQVRNEIGARLRDVTKVGEVLDQTLQLGANSVSGPTFTVADPGTLQDRARRQAIDDAMRKGALYATGAKVRLGPIMTIEEISAAPPQPMPMATFARAKDSAGDVPIETGELTFQAQVSVTWQIAQ